MEGLELKSRYNYPPNKNFLRIGGVKMQRIYPDHKGEYPVGKKLYRCPVCGAEIEFYNVIYGVRHCQEEPMEVYKIKEEN
jgi:hypothetical protein